MDGCKDHYIAQCRFWFCKVVSEKWRRMLDRVLGGYCRGTMEFRVLEGYCQGNDDGHV
jgi:hypothetical protein